jgi:hypothetical protein
MSSFDEWLIGSREYYRMANDESIFSALNECNTKQYLSVMIDRLVL